MRPEGERWHDESKLMLDIWLLKKGRAGRVSRLLLVY